LSDLRLAIKLFFFGGNEKSRIIPLLDIRSPSLITNTGPPEYKTLEKTHPVVKLG